MVLISLLQPNEPNSKPDGLYMHFSGRDLQSLLETNKYDSAHIFYLKKIVWAKPK
jgi:hypothetical protein